MIAVARTAITAHIENSTCDKMECMVSYVGHGAGHKPKILLGSRLEQPRCFTEMELTNNQ